MTISQNAPQTFLRCEFFSFVTRFFYCIQVEFCTKSIGLNSRLLLFFFNGNYGYNFLDLLVRLSLPFASSYLIIS